jgi:hypothetical protein
MGFQVTSGIAAVITTIVGAAVAANLSVLTLDISRDRTVADRRVEVVARETLEARPSTG